MEATLNGPYGHTALGPKSLFIGRATDNQLVVNDPKTSSHHAEIRPEGQGYSVVDMGSTNGTFINEQRIQPNVPRLLAAGDRVRIGDTIFTYEVTGVSQIEPTIYAANNQGDNAGYPPTVAAPPFTGYGSDAQQGAPQAYEPPPAYQGYPYAPPAQQYAPQYAPQPMSSPAMPGYAAPVPVARRKSRRGLWIALGIIGGVLLISIILFIILFAVIAANVSTPTRTLNAFCNALKSGDYRTAYNQLSSGLQNRYGSEAQFALEFSTNGPLGKVTDCTVSNVNDSAGTGMISYTFASRQTLVDDYILIKENNIWKINAQQPRT
jgi:FHA domain